MATIIGESVALKDVLNIADRAGVVLVDPADVWRKLSEGRRQLQQQLAQVEDDLARQENVLSQHLVETKLQCKHDAATAARQLQLDIA